MEQEKNSNDPESYFSNQQNMTKNKYHGDDLPFWHDFLDIDVIVNEGTKQ